MVEAFLLLVLAFRERQSKLARTNPRAGICGMAGQDHVNQDKGMEFPITAREG